jgi:membrane protease YdiL (CAAX protease family)
LGLWSVLGFSAAGSGIILLSALLGLAGMLPFVFAPFVYVLVVAAVATPVWLAGRSFREYLAIMPLRWGDVGRGIGYGLLGFIALGMIFLLIGLLQMAFGDPGSQTAPVIAKAPLDAQTMVLLASLWMLMVIGAPIGEELLFRGLMYRGLESRIGALGAIVLTSIVFGLLHYPGFGWPRVVATGCLGLMFGWLRWRTGSTSVCIVAHAMTNLVGASILTAIVLTP